MGWFFPCFESKKLWKNWGEVASHWPFFIIESGKIDNIFILLTTYQFLLLLIEMRGRIWKCTPIPSSVDNFWKPSWKSQQIESIFCSASSGTSCRKSQFLTKCGSANKIHSSSLIQFFNSFRMMYMSTIIEQLYFYLFRPQKLRP